MGWGEEHEPANGGAGTTGEIELAHTALDLADVPRHGSLASRVIALVATVREERRGA